MRDQAETLKSQLAVAKNAEEELREAAKPTSSLSLRSNRFGSWSLTGKVPDEKTKDGIEKVIGDAFGANNIKSSVEVSDEVRAWPWKEGFSRLINQLGKSNISNLSVNVEDDTIRLGGNVRSETERRAISKALEELKSNERSEPEESAADAE